MGLSHSLGCIRGGVRIPRLQPSLLCGLHAAVWLGCSSRRSQVSSALALSCLSVSSRPILAPLSWPSLHHVLCLLPPTPPRPLWLSSLSVAHLKDRRLSGGAGSPWPARPLMHGRPAQPLPCSSATLQPHCVLLWCGTFSCSAQLKAPEDPCSSTDPGLLRALSHVGPDASWS